MPTCASAIHARTRAPPPGTARPAPGQREPRLKFARTIADLCRGRAVEPPFHSVSPARLGPGPPRSGSPLKHLRFPLETFQSNRTPYPTEGELPGPLGAGATPRRSIFTHAPETGRTNQATRKITSRISRQPRRRCPPRHRQHHPRGDHPERSFSPPPLSRATSLIRFRNEKAQAVRPGGRGSGAPTVLSRATRREDIPIQMRPANLRTSARRQSGKKCGRAPFAINAPNRPPPDRWYGSPTDALEWAEKARGSPAPPPA